MHHKPAGPASALASIELKRVVNGRNKQRADWFREERKLSNAIIKLMHALTLETK